MGCKGYCRTLNRTLIRLNSKEEYQLKHLDYIALGSTKFVVDFPEGLPKEEVKKAEDKREEEKLKLKSKLEDKLKCKICYENDANSLFIPCHHNAACYGCATKCQQCPICRRKVESVIQIFRA